MPARTSEKDLCPSLCLSNAWIVTKRKKDLSSLYQPSFLRKRMVGGGNPFADLQSIFARSASAVASIAKQFN